VFTRDGCLLVSCVYVCICTYVRACYRSVCVCVEYFPLYMYTCTAVTLMIIWLVRAVSTVTRLPSPTVLLHPTAMCAHAVACGPCTQLLFVLGAMLGCHRMPSDAVGYCRILSDIVGYCRILSDIVGYCPILSDIVGCRWLLSDAVGCADRATGHHVSPTITSGSFRCMKVVPSPCMSIVSMYQHVLNMLDKQ